MKNILIFGSCVTRDIIAFYPEGLNLIDYYGRSSIISAVSKPLMIKVEQLNLTSEFQKRMVMYDCNKEFFKKIESYKFDLLIIDFIDERFDINEFNSGYYTRSVEHINSGLDTQYTFKRIGRYSEELGNMWYDSANVFIKKLLTYVPIEKIILNRSCWAERYISEGKEYEFDNDLMVKIKKNNALLEKYFNFFEEKLKGIKVIKSDNLIADKNHKWGFAPVHYYDEVYNNLKKQIINY